tara:strand:+ start:199 stop:615 length:417 start_codon:yes stop_codon:yes gene_type:complete
MIDDIAVLYESIYDRSIKRLITEVDAAEVDTTTADQETSADSIGNVNIYVKPDRGPIQRPYSGSVVNSTRLEDNVTIIAKDESNDKLLQVILLDDGEIIVNIQDGEGRVQDTFMGQNLDFYDTDNSKKELNIIKIENV